MRLAIDQELCQGTGLCTALAPDIFTLCEDGTLEASRTDITDSDRADVEQAVLVCPTGALALATE